MAATLHNGLSALLLSIVVLPQAPGLNPQLVPAIDERLALKDFRAAVQNYVEVRRLYEPMPLDAMTADMESIARARETLAAGIRYARVPAEEGDVFGPRVEALIRSRITRVGLFFNEMPGADEGDGRRTPALGINDPLPWGISIRVPTDMLALLPPIPEGLEYRLAGNDLLLWDAGVDLIVDVLRGVLP